MSATPGLYVAPGLYCEALVAIVIARGVAAAAKKEAAANATSTAAAAAVALMGIVSGAGSGGDGGSSGGGDGGGGRDAAGDIQSRGGACVAAAPAAAVQQAAVPRKGCGDNCFNRSCHTTCDQRVCPSGASCSNRPFHLLTAPRTKTVLTENRGWGLFTTEVRRHATRYSPRT